MRGRKAQVLKEANEHTRKATELLKQSLALHRAEKNGLLNEGAAAQAMIELNKQAVEEVGKAVELRRNYFEDAE